MKPWVIWRRPPRAVTADSAAGGEKYAGVDSTSALEDPSASNVPIELPSQLLADLNELFDHKYYAERYKLDPGGQMDRATLFNHWRTVGRFEGMDPHPLFSIEYYAANQNADELRSVDHIVHFLTRRRNLNVSPHPMFDTRWYSETYSDVRSAGVNPLIHYLKDGYKEGRRPSPNFDGNWYLRQYADVREAGLNPLIHYVLFGSAEGRFRSESDLESAARTTRPPRNSDGGYFLRNVEAQSYDAITLTEPGPSLRWLSSELADIKLISHAKRLFFFVKNYCFLRWQLEPC